MAWLAGNNWLWLVLAAVLGGLVTAFLTLRKATVVTERVESVAARGDGPSAAGGAVGVGAAGAGALGVGALAADRADLAPEPEPSFAPPSELTEEYVEEYVEPEPATLSAGDAGWAPVSSPEAAGWAPVSEPEAAGWAPVSEAEAEAEAGAEAAGSAAVGDEPVAEAEAAVEVPEAVEADYRGSHAGPTSDPLSDPLFAGTGTVAAGPATAAVAAGAYGKGSADPVEGGAAPSDEFTIKGNADSMKFHTAESPYFGRTKAEVWFDSEESARGAGFHRWDEKGADAAPAALAAVPEGAFGPGSADPLEGGAAPSNDFTIKGNADSMKFHTPDSPYFGRTKAEVWFGSEESARGAGFHRWDEKVVAAVVAVPDGAYGAGSADPLEGGDSPGASFTVKGNADSMLFHDTDSPYYSRTKAEVWFDSAETARKAGFAAWNDR
jgi:hypothetical protein